MRKPLSNSRLMTSGELFVHSALTCVIVAWLNNVLPDDHSRVILRSVSGQAGDSTYINANYIEGYYKPRSYIACQVSTSHTTCCSIAFCTMCSLNENV